MRKVLVKNNLMAMIKRQDLGDNVLISRQALHDLTAAELRVYCLLHELDGQWIDGFSGAASRLDMNEATLRGLARRLHRKGYLEPLVDPQTIIVCAPNDWPDERHEPEQVRHAFDLISVGE